MTALDRRRVARHEAGHAAALIIGGRLPKLLTADWPHPDSFGVMEIDWGEEGVTREGAADLLISLLMGPLAAGDPWPPEWPLRRGVPGDEGQLAACVSYLKVDEDTWYATVRDARTLAKTDDFKRLTALIARALELEDELDANALRWLVGSDTLRKFGINEEEDRGTRRLRPPSPRRTSASFRRSSRHRQWTPITRRSSRVPSPPRSGAGGRAAS